MKQLIYFAFFLTIIIAFESVAKELTYTLEGIQGELLKNANLRLSSLNDPTRFLSKDEAESLAQTYQIEIKKALEPYGYFKPTIRKKTLKQKNGWQFNFMVHPGPAMLWRNVSIDIKGQGKNNEALREIINASPIKSGKIFNVEEYNALIDALFKAASSQGYFSAQMDQKKIKINLDNYYADLDLQLNTKALYFFGSINFSEPFYDHKFLQRFVDLKSDEPYNPDKLFDLQQRLTKSPYFNRVAITPLTSNISDQHIPIDITATAPSRFQYLAGIGYGTDTGPRTTLGYNWNRITRSGQYLNTLMSLSSIQKNIGLNYFIPAKNPLTDRYVLGFNYQDMNPNIGQSKTYKLSGAYVNEYDSWMRSFSLNYIQERFRDNNDSPFETDHLIMPEAIYQWSSLDRLVNPTKGLRAKFTLRGALPWIFTDNIFVQGLIDLGWIHPIISANNLMILRTDLGYTDVKNLDEFPLSLQFFAGGINNLRGFAYNDLGPGRYLTTATAEFQHKIYKDFYALTFFDVGNAFSNTPVQMQRSVGLGLNWRSLIGSIQLGVAEVLTKPSHPKALFFSIGTTL